MTGFGSLTEMMSWMVLLSAVSVLFISRTACRQMCLTCQYVDNPKKDGMECASAPHNWTFGNTRMRCNFRCTIAAHFDKKTGDPTYFNRGCSTSNEADKEGCYEDEVKEYCSFSCVNDNYCNSEALPTAPSKKDSGSSQLTSLPGWLAIAANVVYFAVVKV